jgi:hypothetical protein
MVLGETVVLALPLSTRLDAERFSHDLTNHIEIFFLRNLDPVSLLGHWETCIATPLVFIRKPKLNPLLRRGERIGALPWNCTVLGWDSKADAATRV